MCAQKGLICNFFISFDSRLLLGEWAVRVEFCSSFLHQNQNFDSIPIVCVYCHYSVTQQSRNLSLAQFTDPNTLDLPPKCFQVSFFIHGCQSDQQVMFSALFNVLTFFFFYRNTTPVFIHPKTILLLYFSDFIYPPFFRQLKQKRKTLKIN